MERIFLLIIFKPEINLTSFFLIIFATQKSIQIIYIMEISGKIIAVLPIASGEGRNGMWRSQDYVLETADQYPKRVCFNLFGDKIDQFPIAIDDQVNVSFDIESKEYNGRWFTNIRAWKVDKNASSVSSGSPVSQQSVVNAQTFDATPQTGNGSDLPF